VKLSDNTILVAGGTSGIGRALAEQLHLRGNRVIIAGRRQASLESITTTHPGMYGIELDLADPRSIEACVVHVKEQFPTLNVLANIAAISQREDLVGDPHTDARSMIETNIVGVLHLTVALLPLLLMQPHGAVVATTSAGAFVPNAMCPTYSASKAFLHSWLQSFRFQLRKTSVELLELIPPYTQTELSGPAQATDPRAVPLAKFVADAMRLLGESTGKIVVDEVRESRWAERAGHYDAVFARRNEGGG
jgi:uncharacterized oxidoreductase